MSQRFWFLKQFGYAPVGPQKRSSAASFQRHKGKQTATAATLRNSKDEETGEAKSLPLLKQKWLISNFFNTFSPRLN